MRHSSCHPPSSAFVAVLFDWDGTLVDTEKIHAQAWKNLLAPAYHPADERVWYGVPDQRMFADLRPGLPARLQTVETALSAKQQAYAQLLGQEGPPPVAGAELVVRALQPFTLAIVTASPRCEIEAGLDKFGWQGVFKTIVSAADITHPKPDPEPYLRAVERLSVDPEKVLVVEDTAAGVNSARAAKLKVLHYRPSGAAPVPGARAIESLAQVLAVVYDRQGPSYCS